MRFPALAAVLLFQSVGLAEAVPLQQWIPVRWDGGPLELVRRERVMVREAEERRVAEEEAKKASRVVGGWSAGTFL